MISSFAFSQEANDSVAISQMKVLGVYYMNNGSVNKIDPIMPEGAKVGISVLTAKNSLVYLGENSDNILDSSPTFYVYIPIEYSNRISAKQFRITSLQIKKGNRQLTVGKGSIFGAKAGANSSIMKVQKLNDECYKLSTSDSLPVGHYGIFYNYGSGFPGKLYDFDVKE